LKKRVALTAPYIVIVKSKVGIVFEVEFHTYFRHSKKNFKKLWTKKVGKSIKISSPKIRLIFQALNQNGQILEKG